MRYTYKVCGRDEKRRGCPLIVHAYASGRALPVGVFFGYERSNTVRLYPADRLTAHEFRNEKLDISYYDLRRA